MSSSYNENVSESKREQIIATVPAESISSNKQSFSDCTVTAEVVNATAIENKSLTERKNNKKVENNRETIENVSFAGVLKMIPGDDEQQPCQESQGAKERQLLETSTNIIDDHVESKNVQVEGIKITNDGFMDRAKLFSSPRNIELSALTGLESNTTQASPSSDASPTILQPSFNRVCGSAIGKLPHICSEPTFGVRLRNKQQQELQATQSKEAAIDCDWPSETALAYCNLMQSESSVDASESPNMVRKSSDATASLPRRVSFPKSDNELVTGYLEPANPWVHVCKVKSISEIAELYMTSCQKHNTKPLQTILDHLKAVDLSKQLRQPALPLRSIRLAPSDCEALEEVFKRVQYKLIDISDCKLDEASASALFEMIEYYEAANELDISYNPLVMTHRGWSSCTYMISHIQELQLLNSEGNPITKFSADLLGNALNTSNLHTLKLEHCSIKGAPLSALCYKLRRNRILKELWLAHNELDCNDADTIAEMLKVNHFLELIDISNNYIGDVGLLHIVRALIRQSNELERRTTFQRTAAIDDDESMSPVETSPLHDLTGATSNSDAAVANTNNTVNDKISNIAIVPEFNVCEALHEQTTDSDHNDPHFHRDVVRSECNEVTKGAEKVKTAAISVSTSGESCDSSRLLNVDQQVTKPISTHHKPPLISSVGSTIEEIDPDEDTEETVRSSTIKNISQNCPTAAAGAIGSGQSMLDKLLSMNSESSSDDGCGGVSNISTDTLAACGSEEASLISDDIFDPITNTATTMTSTISKPDHHANSPSTRESDIMSLNESVITTSVITTASDHMEASAKDRQDNDESLESTKQVLIEEPPAPKAHTTNNSNGNNNNNNNNNTINNNNIYNNDLPNSFLPSEQHKQKQSLLTSASAQSRPQNNTGNAGSVFEVTPEESDCLIGVGYVKVSSGSHVDGRPHDSDAKISDSHHQQPHHNQQSHSHLPSRAMDVNKNTKLQEDFDDTHSTDSAFESASEGDISRHLPEEFSRLSTSLESTRLDDIAKELAIETATIASESNECLIAASALITPSSTPTTSAQFNNLYMPPPPTSLSGGNAVSVDNEIISESNTFLSVSLPSTSMPIMTTTTQASTPLTIAPSVQVILDSTKSPMEHEFKLSSENDVHDYKMPKVTIAEDSLALKRKSSNNSISTSPTPTPPPPSTSPGCASSGLRRTESSCAFLTQSSRNRSQSTDSLCSDNSLDGSIGSADLNFSNSSQLNEKLTKNDTLTRQQRQMDTTTADNNTRTPSGLKVLAVWNNNLTNEAGPYISDLLAETVSLELLNIGKNCLSNHFVRTIKDSLTRNTTLTTLGLQSANLSADGIETLSSVLTFGGNSTVQRIDIRDNQLEVESLTKIAEVLKSNTTVTQIDIDDEPKRFSLGSEAHMDYSRVLENVRSMCSRNEKSQLQMQQEKSAAAAAAFGKRRGGYYLGSRKISLTCHSHPVIVDSNSSTKQLNQPGTSAGNNKLEVKRKLGTRLRSPVPSPPTISPSSSPNRASRFQVYRVTEVSPLSSPLCSQNSVVGLGGLGASRAMSTSSVAIPCVAAAGTDGAVYSSLLTSTSLPTSCSLPSMATISSSTQSIKRLSVSPRSRFHVRKIYEDPNVPLASRTVPPITPPIYPPPTPLSKNAKESITSLSPMTSATTVPLQRIAKILDVEAETMATKPPPTTIITPPMQTKETITTDTFSTPSSSLSTDIKEIDTTPLSTATTAKPTQEKSTNVNLTTIRPASTTSTNNQKTTNTTSITSNLKAAPSLLTTSSSSSSTSSTSTSSPSPTSSSSSSSTSPASNNNSADSSVASMSPQGLTVSGQCPIAVFSHSDNDITLTKNTAKEAFVTTVDAQVSVDNADSNTSTSLHDGPAQQHQQQQQRVRKVSWIANPTAVDKLLTLFHNPATIFQRSSSPETKPEIPVTAVTQHLSNVNQSSLIDSLAAVQSLPQQQLHLQLEPRQHQIEHKSLVPVRKQSPPSWTKLSTDILNVASSSNTELAANTAATTAAAVVTEQSRSFLDAASRQFRDFSKQVFRQNLSFGNEASSTTMSIAANTSTITTPSTAAGNVPIPCGADTIPTVIKQEIKENISPEHTINEETLQTLLQLYGASDNTGGGDGGSSAAEISVSSTILNPPLASHSKDASELQESYTEELMQMTDLQLLVHQQEDDGGDN